jgi:urease gamma subunit
MGVFKLDGFEGYGPDGTQSSTDATLDRRMNMRWHRLDSDFSPGSKIIGSTSARGGELCWDMFENNGHTFRTYLPNVEDIVMGFAIKPTTDQYGTFFYFRHGGSQILHFGIDSMGRIWLKDSTATLIATSAPVVKFRRWTYIEIKATFHDTAGSVEVRVNGGTTAVISETSLDTAVTHNHADNIQWFYRDTTQWDDIYLIDQDTAGLSDFIGPAIVRRLSPSADTATADFTPSTGSDNYAMVDDARADDADYVSSSTVTDDDLYDYDNLPSEVNAVKAVAIVTSFYTTGGSEAKQIAALTKSGTTAIEETGVAASISDLWQDAIHITETDPDTSSPWTVSGLNAAKFGVRHKA